MKHPRILMTADAVGGIWVFASTLARALARSGCEVVLVTLGPRPEAHQRTELAGSSGVRLIETDLPLEWMDPAGRQAGRTRQELAAIAAEAAPDVVHLNSFREAAGDWRAPVVVTAHSCVFSWWHATRGGEPPGNAWQAYRAYTRAGLAAADAWVAPSRAMREEIARIYRPRKPGWVISNGMEPLPPGPGERRPVVTAVGRLWDEGKNIAVLDAAAEKIHWPVRVMGPDIGAAGQGAAGRFRHLHTLGPLPRRAVLGELETAEIYVSPARFGPFGLSVLEAASCGAALVLSDIPAFRELWGGAALLVPPDDEAALAKAVNGLIAEPERRQALAATARARAARYPLRATVNGYLRLYARLTSGAAAFDRIPDPLQPPEATAPAAAERASPHV
ncbi:MAG: glycosyltransferase family 4 protein [Alphaproteobacteria bacterium]